MASLLCRRIAKLQIYLLNAVKAKRFNPVMVLGKSLADKPLKWRNFTALKTFGICLLFFFFIVVVLTAFFSVPKTTFRPTFSDANSLSPFVEATNESHILFGIGGSAATWSNRRHYSSQWWNPNTMRGFVWLDHEPEVPLSTLPGPPCRVSSSAWTTFKTSSSGSAVRIARILLESFNLGLPNVRWFVLGDDDTVFFVENLVSVLSRYDHNQMWYIGGNSESVEQDVIHSYSVAFGGGGYAVSYPLAKKLARILDGCLNRYFYYYGSEERVGACIAEIGVYLTLRRGFHQMDIRGDPYGILAAHPPEPFISLHHLDYMDSIFTNKTRVDGLSTLMKSYRADPARILQQTYCLDSRRNWSVSISWGYTVQLYPWLVMPVDMQLPLQTFTTWGSGSNGPFTFKTRPVSPDSCRRPIVYMFTGEMQAATNQTSIIYKNSGVLGGVDPCQNPDYVHAMLVESIVVLSEKLRKNDTWADDQSPRRQCCDMVDDGKETNKTMRLQIRKCRVSETLAGMDAFTVDTSL